MTESDLLSSWAIAYISALWLAIIFWTYRDARSRIARPLPILLSTMLTVAFFLPGIFIYLLVRPGETIEDRYLRTLKEESLLRAIEAHEIFEEE